MSRRSSRAATLSFSGALALSVLFHALLLAGALTPPGAHPAAAAQHPDASGATRVTLWTAPASPKEKDRMPPPAGTGTAVPQRLSNHARKGDSPPSRQNPERAAPPDEGQLPAPEGDGARATEVVGALEDAAGPARGGGEGARDLGESEAAGSRSHATAAAGDKTAELHRRLAESARSCYPAAARRFGQRGEVEVAFCLSGGRLASVELLGTTRAPALDKAAQDCVVQGAMPLPLSEGCFRVPVLFQ